MSAEEDIRRVLAQYCHAIDSRDGEAYVSLFSKDTRMYNPEGVRRGHAGIWEHVNLTFSRWGPDLMTCHFLGASDIEVDGNTAKAVTDVVVFHCMPETPWSTRQTARYIDEFVVEDGEWRISARRFDVDTYVREYSA